MLSLNPYNTNLDIVPLKNKSNHYRLRIGKYRFLYEIKNKELLKGGSNNCHSRESGNPEDRINTGFPLSRE